MFDFFLGDLKEFSAAPLECLDRRLAQTPGDEPVQLRIAGRNAYFVRRPDQTRHILADNAANYTKGMFQKRLRPLLGDGLITADGERWKTARDALKGIRLDGGMDLALAIGLKDITRLVVSDTPVSLPELAGRLTIRMSTAALAETALPQQTADELFTAASGAHDWVSDIMWRPIHVDLPLPTAGRRRFKALVDTLDNIVADLRKEPQGVFAALAVLEQIYGSKAVRDEFVTMLLAGFETTASTAAWLLYVLADKPDTVAWIREEVDSVLAGGKDLTSEDLKKLPRTKAVVEEVLRLYPSVWWYARENKEIDSLGGVTIPKGSSVFLCPWLMHREADLFPDPNRFAPSRWMTGKLIDRWSFIPFGAGPRVCLGQHLARGELTALAALVVAGFDLEPLSGPIDGLKPVGGVTLAAPKDGLHVRFNPRATRHAQAA
ncbi:MAG: cytochrome P450 [Rhodospirillaceae bacterium]